MRSNPFQSDPRRVLPQVLFATETFSTGLNMPAKCVVFAGIRKFDGVAFRWLTGGEYIQMSGRAGRRGLDDKGVVVMMIDSKMEPAIAKQVIRGTPDVMASEFRLSYNMLLNVIRLDVAELRPEALITRSLRQWQMRTALPALEARAAALDAAADAVAIGENEDEEVAAEQLFVLLQELAALSGAARDVANLPQFALPFLQPGRLVRVLLPPRDLTAGPIVPAQAPHTPGALPPCLLPSAAICLQECMCLFACLLLRLSAGTASDVPPVLALHLGVFSSLNCSLNCLL